MRQDIDPANREYRPKNHFDPDTELEPVQWTRPMLLILALSVLGFAGLVLALVVL